MTHFAEYKFLTHKELLLHVNENTWRLHVDNQPRAPKTSPN